jgi:hypothetical protein
MLEVPHHNLVASTPWEDIDRLSHYCLYENESGKQNYKNDSKQYYKLSELRKHHQQCLFL